MVFCAKGFPVLRWPLGAFLILAAWLKVDGMGRLAAGGSFLTSPQMQAVAVEAEIVIACLLLCGRYPRLAWVLAISFFAVVGGVSFYVALTGQKYCASCFGVARISSRAMCAFDWGMVALLAVCRPELRGGISWRAIVGVLGALIALCGLSYLLATDAALASLRGKHISVTRAVSDLGDGQAGERRTFEIRLTNQAPTTITVHGGAKSCGCNPTADLPLVLAPGESRSISVTMGFAGSPGHFQHSVRLYTNDEAQPVATARFRGRVIE
jgi:hypothetical protein